MVLKQQEFKDDEIPILDEAALASVAGITGFVCGLRKRTNTHVNAYAHGVNSGKAHNNLDSAPRELGRLSGA